MTPPLTTTTAASAATTASRLTAISSHLTPSSSSSSSPSTMSTHPPAPTVTKKPPITCHVLDTVAGKPATGIVCFLEQLQLPYSSLSLSSAIPLATGITNADGRVTQWTESSSLGKEEEEEEEENVKVKVKVKVLELAEGRVYKIRFETGSYWSERGVETFFPYVEVVFRVGRVDEHYHVPLLLAPWSYSTYRGS